MHVIDDNARHFSQRYALFQHIDNQNPRSDKKSTTVCVELHAFRAGILVVNLHWQSNNCIILTQKLFPQCLSLCFRSGKQQNELTTFLLRVTSQQSRQNLH
jgi:hypothetical protein